MYYLNNVGVKYSIPHCILKQLPGVHTMTHVEKKIVVDMYHWTITSRWYLSWYVVLLIVIIIIIVPSCNV